MTVGNFLQNQGIQESYINEIKNEEIKNKHPQNVNIININYNNNSNINGNIIMQTKTAAPIINNNSVISTSHSLPQNVGALHQPKQEKGKKGDFPPSLQNYITRAFQRCKNNDDIEHCQKNLLLIMENTMKKGDMMTRDWNNYPLPDITSVETTQKKNPSPTNKPRKEHQSSQNKKKEKKQKNSSQVQGPSSQSALTDYLKKSIESYKPIIGTCTDLEKAYYRMIEHPDPSEVRPEHILKKSLKMLIEKWKKGCEYRYIEEQFRSIRQDLTVQQIQNEFSVKVYETHARIALESGDIPQFNQCQTALIPLYEKKIKGNQDEFFAYRILYTSLYEKTEMINILSKARKKYVRGMPMEVKHAIKVLTSLNETNFFTFFKLYKIAPNLGKELMDPFLPRLRIKALQTIAYGYLTEIGIELVADKLAFKTKEDCVKFLNENGVKHGVNKNGTEIMFCKDSIPALNSSKLLTSLIHKK